jgi:hypothetical protein
MKHRNQPTNGHVLACAIGAVTLFAASCGDPEVQRPEGKIDLDTKRPTLAQGATVVPQYTGTDPVVLEAAARLGTGLDLHKNVIVRTCGPTSGVCHNQKEYPDLHTASYLVKALGAPCNVQPGDWSAVFDGCEQPGDTFSLGDNRKRVEIAYIEYIPGEREYGDGKAPAADAPGLHVHLAEALDPGDRNSTWSRAGFTGKTVTTDGKVMESTYADYETEWWYLAGGRHMVGGVDEWQVARVEGLLQTGVTQGDMNRNGVFGAREAEPLHLLQPGDPERSYLIGRVRGQLKGTPIPGTRMPLANQPLSVAEMLGLYCFIEGAAMPTAGEEPDMLAPINYEDCSWAENPQDLNLLGENVTWSGFVLPLLQANCGGCHGGANPLGNFDVMSEGIYDRLLTASAVVPTMPLITPGSLEMSYLWLKLTGGEGMAGLLMPLDSTNMPVPLSQPLLDDVATWITNGAKAQE